jgi:hypothetical protein
MDKALEDKIRAAFANPPAEEPAPAPAPAPTPAPAPKPADPDPAPAEVDRKKILSEFFGEEFTDEDQAKTHISSLKEKVSKVPEYESAIEKHRRRVEELEAGIDPMQFFANENEYKRQLLLKEFPAYSPELLTTITTGDLTKKSAVDLLVIQKRLNDPDVFTSDESARSYIYDEYSFVDRKTGDTVVYDEDKLFEEQDERIQQKIKLDSKKAVAEFETIKGKVKPFEKVDVAAKKAQSEKELAERREKFSPLWNSAFRDLPEKVKAVKFEIPYKNESGDQTDILEFALEEGFLDKVKAEIPKIVDVVAANGIELNKENEQKIVGGAVKKVLADYFGDMNNITKLLTKQRNELLTSWNERQAAADAGVPGITGRERPDSQREIDQRKTEVSRMKDYLDKKGKGQI